MSQRIIVLTAVAGLIAGSVATYAASSAGDGQSVAQRYQVGPATGKLVWRMDTFSGELSLCHARSLWEAPYCGPWGSQPIPPQEPAAQIPRASDQRIGELTGPNSEKPSTQRGISDEEFQRLLNNLAPAGMATVD